MRVSLKVAWGERSEQALMKMAAFSAACHIVALVLLSVIPRFTEPVRPPRPAIAEIVPASALLPAAAPPGPTARPAGPTPSQRAEEAKEAALPKPPPPARKEEPKPAPRKPPRSTAPPPPGHEKQEKPATSEPEPPASTGPPAGSSLAAPEAQGGGVSFGGSGAIAGVPSIGSSSFPYDYYRSSLAAILQSNWRRPVAPDGLQESLGCRIQFTILKSGIIQDPRIVESSGNGALDQSALRAVYDSNPLPPLPLQYGYTSVGAEVLFELTPD